MAPSAIEIPLPTPKTVDAFISIAPQADTLKSPSSPLPEVQTFDASTCTVEQLVAALRVAGGVVIRGLLDKDELVNLETDVRPWLDKDTAWGDGECARFCACCPAVYLPRHGSCK